MQPRASRDEILGVHDRALKIRVTAAPVDGKANQQLQQLLAQEFGVPRKAVALVNGATGRRKTFRIVSPARLPDHMKPE